MKYGLLIDEYLRGPRILRESISGMTTEQLHARPNQGGCSIRENILHVVDFDMICANDIKRLIVEDRPTILVVPSNLSRLAYSSRNVNHDIWLLKGIRRHMATILQSIDADDFERVGLNAADGALTLADLLRRVTDHIPHHVRVIKDKRFALDVDQFNLPLQTAAKNLH